MPFFERDEVETTGRWRLLAGCLIAVFGCLNLAYLAVDCPLDLAPDEAHYWDWSRLLDWSYYSKGPLVAYLIHGSCRLFGEWSLRLSGSAMPAVRLPAVVCCSLLLVSLYILTVQVFRREKLAVLVVALAMTLPTIVAGATLITIDSPYTCCWGWALVAGHHAVIRQARWAWPAAGLLVGLGILAKYTMALWIPSLALFLIATPAFRPQLRQQGYWVMVATAAFCCLPIVIWNAQNDWVTVRHVGGQAGIRVHKGVLWLGPLAYVGTQFGLLLGYWFVAWLAAMIQFRPGSGVAPGVQYLWWMSAPMFLFFLGFSLKTVEEANWPITAYISGLVLAVAWLAQQLRSPNALYRRASMACLLFACLFGLSIGGVMRFSPVLQPVLAWVSGPPTERHPKPLRRFDPTCRLRGWRTLAAEIDLLRARLSVEGSEPVIVCSGWALPGELAFYCEGQPRVYSVGLALGDRHSQYDLWRPNPLFDPDPFIGRTFLFVGGGIDDAMRQTFEEIEETQMVVHRERGLVVSDWPVTICRGFRGFPDGLVRTARRGY